MTGYVVGVDLGGTKVEACLMDGEREVYRRCRRLVEASLGLDRVRPAAGSHPSDRTGGPLVSRGSRRYPERGMIGRQPLPRGSPSSPRLRLRTARPGSSSARRSTRLGASSAPGSVRLGPVPVDRDRGARYAIARNPAKAPGTCSADSGLSVGDPPPRNGVPPSILESTRRDETRTKNLNPAGDIHAQA